MTKPLFLHFANETQIINGFYWMLHRPGKCGPMKNVMAKAKLVSKYNPLNADVCPYCNVKLPKGYIELTMLPGETR